MADKLWHHVINVLGGRYDHLGSYRSHDSADRRASNVQGGETSVFATYTTDPVEAVQEFKAEEMRLA